VDMDANWSDDVSTEEESPPLENILRATRRASHAAGVSLRLPAGAGASKSWN
jgi:hypothetical protein